MASTIEGGSLSQLFATPVWSFRATGGAELAAGAEARLRALRDRDTRWDAGGRPAYWQSHDRLHEDPGLAGVTALVDEAARAAVKLLEVECTLRITSLWGNIGGAGRALHEHTHPNNFLSGVFYVRVPPGSGATSFKDPRPQARVLRPRALRDNPLNSSEFRYEGAPGALLLFPAWLEHGVEANRSPEERITLAMNLMVKGPLGSREQLAYSEV